MWREGRAQEGRQPQALGEPEAMEAAWDAGPRRSRPSGSADVAAEAGAVRVAVRFPSSRSSRTRLLRGAPFGGSFHLTVVPAKDLGLSQEHLRAGQAAHGPPAGAPERGRRHTSAAWGCLERNTQLQISHLLPTSGLSQSSQVKGERKLPLTGHQAVVRPGDGEALPARAGRSGDGTAEGKPPFLRKHSRSPTWDPEPPLSLCF